MPSNIAQRIMECSVTWKGGGKKWVERRLCKRLSGYFEFKFELHSWSPEEMKSLFAGLSCRINDLKVDVRQLCVHIAVRRSHCGPWCADLSTYLSLIVNLELER